MTLKLEVHVPSNDCMVTAIVHNPDDGLNLLLVYSKGRWKPLAASVVGQTIVHLHGGDETVTIPVEVEGDLNRMRDKALIQSRGRRHVTLSYP